MARTFVPASSNYGRNGNGIVTAVPIFMAAWIRPASITGPQVVLGCFNSGSTGAVNHFSLGLNNALSIFTTCDGSTGSVATSSAGFSGTNVWGFIAGGSSAANSRAAWFNVGNKGTNGTSRTPSGIDRTSIGRRDNVSADRHFSGDVGIVGLWNIFPSDAEVEALAGGVHFRKWRPDGLVGCWPWWGDHSPEIDIAAGLYPMTLNGAPAKASQAEPMAPLAWGR